MIIEVDQAVPEFKSYAAERTRGLYNVDADDGSRFQLKVDIPVDTDRSQRKTDWSIGVVVGPSGSGKSSILRELAKNGWHEYHAAWDDGPVIEELSAGEGGDYAKATAALAAVGLGSVPSWLRPRQVLSMGEGFRADLAQLLLMRNRVGRLRDDADVMIDEFTSVLDRQVAQVGAGAFAKAWRRKPGRRVILFTCHYDVLDWIQPDWWIDTAEGLDTFAGDRGVVQARQGTFQSGAVSKRGYPGPRIGTIEC